MPRAGSDAAKEKKINEENKVAIIATIQNSMSFSVVCGLIIAAPWALNNCRADSAVTDVPEPIDCQ